MSQDHYITRGRLIEQLMEKGYSRRRAREAVNVIVDSIRAALLRGETVDLPIGTFEVVEHQHRPTRGWFLDRVRVTYRQRKYIRFTPKELS